MAAALIAALRDRQVPVLALDGDILRERLCRNLYRWSEVREYCRHLLKESS